MGRRGWRPGFGGATGFAEAWVNARMAVNRLLAIVAIDVFCNALSTVKSSGIQLSVGIDWGTIVSTMILL